MRQSWQSGNLAMHIYIAYASGLHMHIRLKAEAKRRGTQLYSPGLSLDIAAKVESFRIVSSLCLVVYTVLVFDRIHFVVVSATFYIYLTYNIG